MRERLRPPTLMMVTGLVVIVVLLPLLLNMKTKSVDTKVSATYTHEEFIKEITPIAQDLSQYYGVKPSIIIAQAAYASDFGNNLLALKYHNVMGLVAKPGESRIVLSAQSYESGRWKTVKQPYAIYPTWRASLQDYLEVLSDDGWGKHLYPILASSNDYKQSAKALQQYGFSSEPDYSKQLVAIIEGYQLTTYDK